MKFIIAAKPNRKITTPAILFNKKIFFSRILLRNLFTTELIINHHREAPEKIPTTIVRAGINELLSNKFIVVKTARNAKIMKGLVKVSKSPEK